MRGILSDSACCPARLAHVVLFAVLGVFVPGLARGGPEEHSARPAAAPAGTSPWQVLTVEERQSVERAVDRGLAFLAACQGEEGSFISQPTGQPGVTALCVLAYLSRGHQPGLGVHGRRIERAIDFVMDCQHDDGLLSQTGPGHAGNYPWKHAALYNHAIAGLMLTEAYGMTDADRHEPMRGSIQKAVAFSRRIQLRQPRQEGDAGGWRYLRVFGSSDSDLSVTAWQLMFYRSAKNSGFDIPAEYVQEATAYVRRCFDRQQNLFVYGLFGNDRNISRGMTGAGILSLSLAGEHDTDEARNAGRWLLRQSFTDYNGGAVGRLDRYHYSAYYSSQAMFQLGGGYWSEFYPPLARTLVSHQRPDGSWDREANRDGPFGNAYTTALSVLALTPPYQLLPIYQR